MIPLEDLTIKELISLHHAATKQIIDREAEMLEGDDCTRLQPKGTLKVTMRRLRQLVITAQVESMKNLVQEIESKLANGEVEA